MSYSSAAAEYLTAGYVPLPVVLGGKSPAIPWRAWQVARPSAEAVQEWFVGKRVNVGLVTGAISDLVVVDVDPRNGGDPTPFWGSTPTVVQTPSGGWHFYYRAAGEKVKTRAGALPGVDIRAEGGFVVAPPSKRDDGAYAWHGAAKPHANMLEHAFPPFTSIQAAFDPCRPTPPGDKVYESWITEALGGVAGGTRNQTCARLSGYLLSKHPKDVAWKMIADWTQRCTPPMDLVEAKVTFDSIVHRDEALREPQTVTAVSCDDYIANNFSAAPRPWVVPGLIPAAALVIWAGAPRSFKSLLLTDLAAAVATGRPFLGHEVVQGPVILMQLEDPPFELAQRVASALNIVPDCSDGDFSRRPAASGAPLYIDKEALFRLDDRKAVKRLREQVAGIRPSLLIVDPLYMAAGAGSQDAYFANIATSLKVFASLRDEYGVTTILVHHTRKRSKPENGEKQANGLQADDLYGSTFLNAATEGLILARRGDGNNQVTLTVSLKAGNAQEGSKTYEIEYDGTRPLAATEPEKEKNKEPKQGLLRAVEERLVGGPATFATIKGELRASTWELRAALEVLVTQGKVRKEGRKYAI